MSTIDEFLFYFDLGGGGLHSGSPPLNARLPKTEDISGVRKAAESVTVLVTDCVGVNGFFSPPKHSDRLWGPHSYLFSGHRGLFLKVKWPRHEVHHSPPSDAKGKKEWRYTSACPACLHGMDRHKCTFLS